MIIKSKIVPVILSCFLLFFAIRYIYTDIFYPQFSYMGFTLRDVDDNNIYFTLFFLLSIISFGSFLPSEINSANKLLLVLSFFVIYIPTLALLTLVSESSYLHYILLYVTLSICILIQAIFAKTGIVNLRIPVFSVKAYLCTFFIIMACALCLVIFNYKFSLANIFNISDISGLYNIRGDFREQNSEVPRLAIYALTISAKVLVPFMLFYGIERKKINIIVISLIIQLLLFLITGQKSVFLGWFLVLGFCLFMRKRNILTLRSICYILALSFVLALTLNWMGSQALLLFVIRRIFIMPGVLGAYYHDFFINHPNMYLSYSFLSPFIENIYNATPPFVIGEYYFSRAEMSANVNYLMAAFADFSLLGMVVYTLILCSIYKVIDCIVIFKNNIRTLSLMLLPTWALLDSSLPTVILTHGLLAILLLTIICPFKRIFP
ncbi:hypothetical protein KQ929_06970 [Leclercia pneumoniae]|uniref:Wzy n=1 Tax=Leclercia pneumoniae TaxID=2815358 RepID=A0ABX8JXG8_9ENTR|nr:hypothetical protein [Leclercia pneumoniae]QSW34108.1 hypothetical protein JZ655_13535 [Leclercia pneumoniae]QWW80966.1 hypothetical protein KQ929_06970 [Leclercia pneumoniae]